MRLSIVSTMYRSEAYLDEFVRRCVAAATLSGGGYELILVNDGSPDDSLQHALRLQRDNSNIKVVDLSRNFGHHAAIVAGLEQARGELVFLIDCDLEEQPEWLALFEQEMARSEADVVFGSQQQRVASAGSNFLGTLFWRALNLMSSVRIPANPMTCRLMKRAYVDALLGVGDRVLYLAGVFAWTGFRQQALMLTKTPRPAQHRSSYNLSRKLLHAVDSFASFSVAPLTLVFFSGLCIWLSSTLYGSYLLLRKLFEPTMVVSGYTSLMVSIWFLSGFIIVALGVIGLYLSKIFQEVKRRPLYIAKKIHDGGSHE